MSEGLISGFVTGLFRLILNFIGSIASTIIAPLLSMFSVAYPKFYDAFANTDFFSRALTGISFAREVFLNVTGFPRVVFYALVNLFFVKVGFMILLRSFKFMIRMYYILRGYHLAK